MELIELSEGIPVPYEYRVRFLDGSTVLHNEHFTLNEARDAETREFLFTLPTNLVISWRIDIRSRGLANGQVVFSNVNVHEGDGALSPAVRAEVSEEVGGLTELIGDAFDNVMPNADGDGFILERRSGENSIEIDFPASTGGGGLSQADVDNRVRDGVADFAEEGNTGTIPDSKISGNITRNTDLPDVSGFQSEADVDARIVDGVEPWARDATTPIPVDKLGNAPSGGGGGGINTHLVGSGNFDVSVNGFWATEADSTDITIDGSIWFKVSTGGRSEGGNVGVYHEIRGEEWRALTPANYGGRADSFIIIEAVNTSGEAYVGRTADNKVLFSAQASSVNAYPLTVLGYNEGGGSGTEGTEGPPGPRGAVGPAGPAGASASDSRVEIHRGTLTTEEGRTSGRWQGIVSPAVCPESGILRFHFFGGPTDTVNTLSSEISASEIRELEPIALNASTASTAANSKSVRASASVKSNATRHIAIARTAENHLLFLQWQGTEFRGLDVVVYQHGAPQEAVAADNYDIIDEERTASESRADVPPIIRSVFNIGFPNTTAPRGNTLLVNLSVGSRSNTLQGEEIEIWVNGAALPDVVVPEGGSAVDFELDDTHRTGTTWTIEARTTTSTGGQLENISWTYSVVRFKNDYEVLMEWTPGDTQLRGEIPWSRAFNRPVILSSYSDFAVEVRDRSSNGISIEEHRIHPERIHSFLATEVAALATKTANVFSVVFSIDGTASLIEAYDRSKSRPGLANPRLSFAFANDDSAGADLMTSIRGVDGVNGLHQTISEGDISIRVRGRRRGTS